jgi:hypothetical protein
MRVRGGERVVALPPRSYESFTEGLLEETGELPSDARAAAGATAAGDPRRLRGIPAIGRGCSGAIPGTRPGDNLFR